MSDPTYLFQRALKLQQENRDAEATEVYRRVVAQDPTFASAWWNLAMLLLAAGQHDEALDAFAAYVRTADPGNSAFVDFARRELLEAGRTPPPARRGAPRPESVQFIVEKQGVRTLLVLDNDSGVDVDSLQQTLKSFEDAWEWMDAYLVLRDHPELTSSLALELLRLRADDLNTRDGQIAQANLRVLERSREAGPDVAFAEVEGMELEDFRLLVRGVDEIQPVLQRLAATSEEEAAAILDAHPEIIDDKATDVLLWSLRKLQPEDGQRAIDRIRAMIEARRR